ncbi:hypothetical protein BDV93DRAFT_576770 [Ceratobasidium sp. AG-I]|nr:hypothetical protein BDV93DRAFT_576770 [Ceratobasidium sp. AG-I]
MFERPRYVDEHPSIRLTYLKIANSNINNHATVRACNEDLGVSLDSLWLAGLERPIQPRPVKTLAGVRRRLGLEIDSFLCRQPVCSECYQRFSFEEIEAAEVDKCFQPNCSGRFWRVDQGKRKPLKCIVYTRLVPSLRRFFLRPDFLEALRAGRDAHDTHQTGPSDILHDVCDGSAWNQRLAGLKRTWRADGRCVDRPTDVQSFNPSKIVSLGYGLLAAVNIDWFGMEEKHSLGAIYVCFLNLHRSLRYRPENTILACIIPGPGEPHLEQLNEILDPLVEEFKTLYAGVVMKIYEDNQPKLVQVNVGVHMLNADSPARAKSNGTGGHAHHSGFCECECEHDDINTEHGYDIDAHTLKDEDAILRLAKNSQQAPTAQERKSLANAHGVKWSSFNDFPQWKPYTNAPLDLMHNLYLGIVKSLWWLLIAAYYFSQSQREAFDSFVSSVEWPSGIGRLPKRLATKGGLRKADEFRRLITVLPIALFVVWKHPQDNSIPDCAEAIHPKSNYREDHKRSRQKIYDLVVLLSAASRLFTSWSVTLDDVSHAQRLLQQYCQGLLRLGVKLQPNHHWSMHYERYFRLYGPAYAWWLFAYERFNGLLENVNTNRHSEDYPMTLARFWTRLHRLYELLQFLPENISEAERKMIERMCKGVDSRGTTLATEAMMAQQTRFTSGKQAQRVDLHRTTVPGLYFLVLDFARGCWPHLQLTSDHEPEPNGYPFLYDQVAEVLPFVYRNGIRFGPATAKRTEADKYAFIKSGDATVPCKIEYLLRIGVAGLEPRLCAVVAHMVADQHIPVMPWDKFAVELGTFTAYADRFSPFTVIPVEDIIAPMALCTFSMRSSFRPQRMLKLWVAILYDRVRYSHYYVVDYSLLFSFRPAQKWLNMKLFAPRRELVTEQAYPLEPQPAETKENRYSVWYVHFVSREHFLKFLSPQQYKKWI